MEKSNEFITYNEDIQNFIINIGLYGFKRLDFCNLSEEEIIMKINCINKDGSDDFYQEKIKQQDNKPTTFSTHID